MWSGFPLQADDPSLAAYLIFAWMVFEHKAWMV